MAARLMATLLILAAAGCASSGSRATELDRVAAISGTRAPLRLVDIDGTLHDLDRVLRGGRCVALVFWQTWCAPCRREAPALAEAARRWEDAIQFVGVIPGPDENVDEEEVRRLAKSFRLPYPQARDRDLSLTRRFGVRGTPTIIVLGPGGVVRYRGHSLPADLEALATAGAQGLVEPLR